MRLRDLDARFVGGWRPGNHRDLPSIEGAQGLLFQCPFCAAGKPAVVEEDGSRGFAGAHYVLCWFANPINAERVPDSEFPGPGRWTFSGTSIDDATLSPSVNLDVHTTHTGDPHECRWHGWVKSGDAA